ncbi:MAG: hypothetical protein KCHDKBKB_02269 [Elusimicrobia bacterium]|nr:hypothetical protein [Elusimicrobiota bacterium]
MKKICQLKTLFLSSLVWFFSSPLWAGLCSLCRETLRQGGGQKLINGFYWSVVVIGIIPLIVIAIGIKYLKRSYR